MSIFLKYSVIAPPPGIKQPTNNNKITQRKQQNTINHPVQNDTVTKSGGKFFFLFRKLRRGVLLREETFTNLSPASQADLKPFRQFSDSRSSTA